MASLNNIRKRISTIETTNKITQAMKLVATAKLQQQKQKFNQISKYVNNLYEMLIDLTKGSKFDQVFIKKEASNKNLYIVISSSLGLCGPYNANVCKFTITNMAKDDEIITIGDKALSFFKSKGYEKRIIASFNYIEKDFSYYEVLPLSGLLIDSFRNGKYQSINLVYTKFINSLSFETVKLQLLPFDPSLFKNDKDNNLNEVTELNNLHQIIDFLPNRHTIINNLIEFFTSTLIVAAITESRLCEYSSRRNAMETASDNAKQLIQQLKLEYNQARQEKITQEINEIIAGS